MKCFLLIVALVASVLTVALVPDHVHGMVYVSSGYLIVSYLLIPRRPQIGWIASLTGNLLLLYPIALLHRIDLMVVPVAFTGLALWNVWNELNKPVSKN
jgi:hypothetical protein